MTRKPVGILTIASAANDDVTAWCLLAVVIAITKAGTLGGALYTVLLTFVLLIACDVCCCSSVFKENRYDFIPIKESYKQEPCSVLYFGFDCIGGYYGNLGVMLCWCFMVGVSHAF